MHTACIPAAQTVLSNKTISWILKTSTGHPAQYWYFRKRLWCVSEYLHHCISDLCHMWLKILNQKIKDMIINGSHFPGRSQHFIWNNNFKKSKPEGKSKPVLSAVSVCVCVCVSRSYSPTEKNNLLLISQLPLTITMKHTQIQAHSHAHTPTVP